MNAITTTPRPCCARVFPGYPKNGTPCTKEGRHEYAGAYYCKWHLPANIEARKERNRQQFLAAQSREYLAVSAEVERTLREVLDDLAPLEDALLASISVGAKEA